MLTGMTDSYWSECLLVCPNVYIVLQTITGQAVTVMTNSHWSDSKRSDWTNLSLV